MKRIFIVLAAAAIAVSLCACGENNNAGSESKADSSADSTISAESKETEGGSLATALERVKKEVTLPRDTSDFNAKRILRTFGIEEDKMEEFAGLYCNDGVTQDQIIYIKAKSNDDVSFIQEKLGNHLQNIYNVIKNYTPEQAAMIEKAAVDVNGKYVSLVISEKADDIKAIFRDAM